MADPTVDAARTPLSIAADPLYLQQPILYSRLNRHFQNTRGITDTDRLVLIGVLQHIPSHTPSIAIAERIMSLSPQYIKLLATVLGAGLLNVRSWGEHWKRGQPSTDNDTPITPGATDILAGPGFNDLLEQLHLSVFPNGESTIPSKIPTTPEAESRPAAHIQRCLERHKLSCAITTFRDDTVEATHIIPYSVTPLRKSNIPLWVLIVICFGEELRDKLYNVLHQASSHPTINGLALDARMHKLFNTGTFVLNPVLNTCPDLENTPYLDLRLRWRDYNESMKVCTTRLPKIVGDQICETQTESIKQIYLAQPRVIEDNDIYRLTTDNPKLLPLPHPLLLFLHSTLWQMIGSSGLADASDKKRKRSGHNDDSTEEGSDDKLGGCLKRARQEGKRDVVSVEQSQNLVPGEESDSGGGMNYDDHGPHPPEAIVDNINTTRPLPSLPRFDILRVPEDSRTFRAKECTALIKRDHEAGYDLEMESSDRDLNDISPEPDLDEMSAGDQSGCISLNVIGDMADLITSDHEPDTSSSDGSSDDPDQDFKSSGIPGTGPLLDTEAFTAATAFRSTFEQMSWEHKWVLPSGHMAEDIIFDTWQRIGTTEFMYCTAGSFVVDISNHMMHLLFTGESMWEIENKLPHSGVPNQMLEVWMHRFTCIPWNGLQSIYRFRDTLNTPSSISPSASYDLGDDFNCQWADIAIRRFLMSIELDVNLDWSSVLRDSFQDLEWIEVVLERSRCLATKLKNRANPSTTDRKKMSPLLDGIFRADGPDYYEYGAMVHMNKIDDPDSERCILDDSKLVGALQDMLSRLHEFVDRDRISEEALQVVGILYNSSEIQLLRMSSPSRYIYLIRREELRSLPQTIYDFEEIKSLLMDFVQLKKTIKDSIAIVDGYSTMTASTSPEVTDTELSE